MSAEIVSVGQDYESPAGNASLMVRIANPDNLRKAYQRVKRNKGAAGIDRMSVNDLLAYLQEHGRELLLHFSQFETKERLADQTMPIYQIQRKDLHSDILVLPFL